MSNNKVRLSSDKIIVHIHNEDKELKHLSKGGIITTHTLKPTLDSCQIGTAIEVGNDLKTTIKIGEMVLFRWGVEHDDENLLERDDNGEYRYVTERQIFGTIKVNKRTKLSHIQPKKYYFVAEPIDDDFERTKSVFQIPVAAINPQDEVAKMIGLKAGDWAICMPYSAVPITVKRKLFFFIFLEDILLLNDGHHKISIARKYVSKDLRLASRKNITQLN